MKQEMECRRRNRMLRRREKARGRRGSRKKIKVNTVKEQSPITVFLADHDVKQKEVKEKE